MKLTVGDMRRGVFHEYVEQSRNSFMTFVGGLVIPSASGPQLFCMCMADFQREFFEDIAPSIEALREGLVPPDRRWWLERTKKAAKDSDLAAIDIWLMAFAERPFQVQVTASNQKQAGIVKARIEAIIHFNSWLNDWVRVVQNKVEGRALGRNLVRTTIEATGTAGAAHGETPDLLILNELVHVDKWEVMKTHRNNADGVPRGIVIVSTNAGFKGTEAEMWRKTALTSTRWKYQVFHDRAPWIDPNDVDEAASRNDPFEHKRLWQGLWISGKGGAVGEEDVAAMFDESLKMLAGLEDEPGWYYAAGLDLGVNHDHAGIAVVGANPLQGRLRVAALRDYPPSVPGGGGKLEVDLMQVEADCRAVSEAFNIQWFGYDPAAGGSFMAQRLRATGVPMVEMQFTPANLKLMAQAFVQVTKARLLKSPPSEVLKRDVEKFEIEAMLPSGFRLKAVSDETGHADVGTALVIVLPKTMERLGWIPSGDWTYSDENDEPLTEEEIEDMPEELREIYEG